MRPPAVAGWKGRTNDGRDDAGGARDGLTTIGTGVAASRERLEAMDRRWTERFEGMDRRIETAEQHNEAAHAAICQSIAKLDARTRADAAALHQRFDALNGRFDDLYRHLLGPAAQTGQPGPAPAAG